MTALIIIGVLLLALVAWRLAALPGLLRARSAAQALVSTTGPGSVIAKGDPTPTAVAKTLQKPLAQRTASDWYDPNTEQVRQTFNQSGFITSPSPLPVNPFTKKTVLTDGDVYDLLVAMGANPRPVVVTNPVDPVPTPPTVKKAS